MPGYGWRAWRERSGATPGFAVRLEPDAAALARFDRDFWLPDEGFYALASTATRSRCRP